MSNGSLGIGSSFNIDLTPLLFALTGGAILGLSTYSKTGSKIYGLAALAGGSFFVGKAVEYIRWYNDLSTARTNGQVEYDACVVAQNKQGKPTDGCKYLLEPTATLNNKPKLLW